MVLPGKFVAYSRGFGADAAGSVIVADTYQDLESKIPTSIYQALEIALGVRKPQLPPERPLDV